MPEAAGQAERNKYVSKANLHLIKGIKKCVKGAEKGGKAGGRLGWPHINASCLGGKPGLSAQMANTENL